ncbi:MAG: CPBP family intramembrane metalloprotease [Phycisphaerae bacterium]|nr:CPBP family intramembrane metalloprotease [Phycisphaerae bacterium]
MVKASSRLPPERLRYGKETHRPLNQLLVIAPLLVIFQLGAMHWGSSLLVPHYLRYVFLQMGVTGPFLSAGLVVAVLLGQHLTRNDPWRVNGWVAGGIVVESALWSVPLLGLSWITRDFTPAAIRQDLLRGVVEAVGAGVYEEFLFRLVLLSVLMMVFVDLLGLRKETFGVVAVVLAGVAFAALHFSPGQWQGEAPLPWGRFVFLSVAGVWWGVLFVWRGFATAVCSHVWWDLFVAAMGAK